MEKKINNESERIVANDIYVDIQELKKIINTWQSGELYRSSYDQGMRGENLYKSIVADITYYAEGLSDALIDNIQKKFDGDVEIDFSIHPKSDIRSIGLEVLEFLEGWVGDPIEKLIFEDIPIILEFLDTPPGKSLEAWNKWEQYWINLDYPERRRKLLEYDELTIPTSPEDEYLTHTKTKVTIGRLNDYSEQGIVKTHEIFDIVQKEFEGKKLRHETIDLLDKDTSRIFYEFEDGAFINLITTGKLEQTNREITLQQIKAISDKWKQYCAKYDNSEQQKELPKYDDLKMLSFPENDYTTTTKTKVTISRRTYFDKKTIEKAQGVFNPIKKEFQGRKLIHERTEVVDKNTSRIIYEFEDGSCIQLITNGTSQP